MAFSISTCHCCTVDYVDRFSSVRSTPPACVCDVTPRQWRHWAGARWRALGSARWTCRHYLVISRPDDDLAGGRRLVERDHSGRRTASHQVQSCQRTHQYRSLFQSKNMFYFSRRLLFMILCKLKERYHATSVRGTWRVLLLVRPVLVCDSTVDWKM